MFTWCTDKPLGVLQLQFMYLDTEVPDEYHSLDVACAFGLGCPVSHVWHPNLDFKCLSESGTYGMQMHTKPHVRLKCALLC